MTMAAHATENSPLPPHYLWTRTKYEQATALGLLGPEDRVELLNGEIIQKMPQNSPHSTAVTLAQEAVRAAFPTGHTLRVQLPLTLGDLSQPEPDIAVVIGSPRDYRDAQPTADVAVLVVEISDASLSYDQGAKAAAYAASGLSDYWIVNLNELILEVHRRPGPIADSMFGYGYREIIRLDGPQAIAPLAADGDNIAVQDLLP